MRHNDEDHDEKAPFLLRSISINSEKRTRVGLGIHAESHQYESDESEVWWHHRLQRNFSNKAQWWSVHKRRDLQRWTLTLLTGLLCGLVALLVTNCVEFLNHFKFTTFHRLIDEEKSGQRTQGSAFMFLIIINLLFAIIGFYSVVLEPLAAGSGIPEVKCFLNGLNIPRLVQLRTMICKAVGLTFACAASLPLGKEGPMVHIGAVIAAVITQSKFPVIVLGAKNEDFCNDREKRDFVACGAASGVAAAFGAPIGGVLFSLEEGSSFWSTALTWRCFFCAMTTVFFLYVVNTARSLLGHSDSMAMFSFGEFFSLQGEQSNYAVWELFLFILIGCLGGIIGALFNYFTGKLFQWRSCFVFGSRTRFLEIVALSMTMSGLAVALSWSWKKCTSLPVDMEGWSDQEKFLVTELVPLYCDSETEYNELASLFLTDSDTAIRQLFHFREIGDHDDYTFSTAALLLFFAPYIFMAAVTNGTALPAGMFVPSLLSGAAFGRLLGHLLHKLDDTRGTFADSGTYALMGAAAITSGIARMTISLTVMVLEATGDMQYVLPLMLTVLMARFVGNIFTEGLYEINIHARNLHFLEEEDEFSRSTELHDLTVRDVMNASLCMHPFIRVSHCLKLMENNDHQCFPVVDPKENTLVGSISRKVIRALIQRRAFMNAPKIWESPPLVDWNSLEIVSSLCTENSELPVEEHKDCWIDLSPYVDNAPYMISEFASLQRAYRMFRTLGLRHLFVVNRHHHVQGIVTRADLVLSNVSHDIIGNNNHD